MRVRREMIPLVVLVLVILIVHLRPQFHVLFLVSGIEIETEIAVVWRRSENGRKQEEGFPSRKDTLHHFHLLLSYYPRALPLSALS
jgi:hypothetical protein